MRLVLLALALFGCAEDVCPAQRAVGWSEDSHAQDSQTWVLDIFQQRAVSLQSLIRPSVCAEQAPWTQLHSLGQFETSVPGDEGLVAWLESRHALVSEELSRR